MLTKDKVLKVRTRKSCKKEKSERVYRNYSRKENVEIRHNHLESGKMEDSYFQSKEEQPSATSLFHCI